MKQQNAEEWQEPIQRELKPSNTAYIYDLFSHRAFGATCDFHRHCSKFFSFICECESHKTTSGGECEFVHWVFYDPLKCYFLIDLLHFLVMIKQCMIKHKHKTIINIL